MKSNNIVLTLAAFLASGLIALAQADAPATDKPTPAVGAQADSATATNATPVAPATNAAPAAAAPEATPTNAAPVTNAAPTTPAPETAPAPAPAAPANSTTIVSATRDPNAVIPLIVMDEVPLTDAIKNLARQAGLNYMLDPKINYGQKGPDGLPIPQPVISLRWENLTPDQALLAVLNNYNLIIVDDPRTKIARITIRDPAAPDPLVSEIIQLRYADPTNILVSVQTAITDKRSKVVADGRTAQLVVLATEKEMANIIKVVAQLDQQTKQVLIEAKLIESDKNPSSVKGIDWSGTLQHQTVTFGNNAQYIVQPSLNSITTTNASGGSTIVSSVVPGLLGSVLQAPALVANTAHGFPNASTFFLNADGVSAVLSFLNSDADTRVLSTPRAVTLDNQMAVLSVVTAEPIFANTAGTQGSPGGSTVTYTNVGTILKVTPHISANNTINLKVIPEVSDVGGVRTKTVAGVVNQADFFDVRKIDTQVLIPSGNTLVMGGLLSDATSKGSIKVPLLGDIPLLGAAFRQSSKAQTKKNLTIFITPTIVQSEDFQPTVTEFLKTKPPSENTSDFGPWDSGKPQDWSKLLWNKKTVDPSDPTVTVTVDPKYPDSK
jgi:type II secretory pathway component GspD/PulD (secretin)